MRPTRHWTPARVWFRNPGLDLEVRHFVHGNRARPMLDFAARAFGATQVFSEMSRVANPCRQPWIVRALLLAFVIRALIPAGFMPAAGFSFQICPEGFPAHLLRAAATPMQGTAGGESGHEVHRHDPAHHVAHESAGADHNAALAAHHASGVPQDDGNPHRHASAGSEHCAFAAAGGPALLAWTPTFSLPATASQASDFVYVAPTVQTLRFRVQQPRGPPGLS